MMCEEFGVRCEGAKEEAGEGERWGLWDVGGGGEREGGASVSEGDGWERGERW